MKTENSLLRAISQRTQSLLTKYKLDLNVSVSFCENNSVLGYWSPDSQIIFVNKSWAMDSDWLSIDALIRHELAHAIVSQILLPNNENADKDHGAIYKYACSLIGYNPTRHSIAETDEDLKIRTKVEKLLSLAESSNEHEASLAMQRANELAIKHSIREMNCDDPIFYVEIPKTSIFSGRKKSRLIEIAKFCKKNYSIQLIWTLTLDDHQNTMKCIEMMGTRHIVEQASYAYDFLLRTGTRLYNEYKKQNKDKNLRGHEKSWWAGFLGGISIDLQKAQQTLRQKEGLIISEDPKLIEAFKSRYPKVVTTYSNHQSNFSANQAGFETGKKTKIHKGCMTHGEVGKFLPK